MRARAFAVVVVALSLLGVAAPAYATSDTTAPVLHSIGLAGPGPFTAGDTATVQWDATDDAGISQVQVGYLDAAGHEKVVVGSGSSGQAAIDYRWANGLAAVRWVWLYDINNNWTVYRPDGTWSSWPSASGTHAIDLHAADLATHDTGEDVTAPVLQAMALTTPATRTVNDPVTLSWTATDAHSYWMQAAFVDSACKQHTVVGNYGSLGSSSTTVDGTWAEGPVTLREVQLFDDSGNMRVYRSDGTAAAGPSANGPWTTGPHAFDFAAMSFAVHSTGYESDPPVPGELSLTSAGPFHEGDVVSVHWTATDATGVKQMVVRLQDGAGKPHTAWAQAGTDVAFTVDSSWGTGQVIATDVELTDTLGNVGDYFRDGHVNRTPACGPAGTHDRDLSVLDFQVASSASPSPSPSPEQADTTAPSAHASAFPRPFTLATAVPFGFSASDAGSGVAGFDVRYTTSTATTGFTPWVLPSAWQGTSSTQLVSPYLAPGRAFCFSARARDHAGNVSPWTPSACVSRAYDDAVAKPGAGWTRVSLSGLYGGSALRTWQHDATATTVSVTVRRIAVVATTCPTCGSVAVYDGGVLVGKLSLVSSTTVRRRVLALPLTGTRTGAVAVRVLSTGRPVELDGLVLSRA